MGELDEKYMRVALQLAEKAAENGEVPVGALVVFQGEIIGTGVNSRESDHDPTAHAEIVAMREAGRRLRSWRLDGCSLYVTLEPCPMCAGAMVNARIERLVFGAEDPKAGAITSLFNLADDQRLNHRIGEISGGVLAEQCGEALKTFFRTRRKEKQSEKKRNSETN